MELPWWLDSKESTCNTEDPGNTCSIPGSGRSARKGNGNPLQYFCLENSKDRRAWQATVHGVARESDMTKQPENLYFYYGAAHCEFFNVLLNTIHNF